MNGYNGRVNIGVNGLTDCNYFFFSSRRRHTRCSRDWSSDVCSSDLTNLETSTEKLLQVVLSGQPELEERLRQPHLRQLRQRITVRCRTSPLSLEETQGYIAERLRIAGAGNGPLFSREAIESIYRHAIGIPRVINVLCEHALINAFADQEKTVSAAHVEGVAHEFELDRPIAPRSTSSENPTSVEKVLRDLSTVLERMRQPVPVGVGSGKESYEPYS